MARAGCNCILTLYGWLSTYLLRYSSTTIIVSAQTLMFWLSANRFISCSLKGENRTGEMAVSVSTGVWIQRHPKVFLLSRVLNQKGQHGGLLKLQHSPRQVSLFWIKGRNWHDRRGSWGQGRKEENRMAQHSFLLHDIENQKLLRHQRDRKMLPPV